MNDVCYLYRAYGAESNLLYVGISYKPKLRMTQHQRDSKWWPDHDRYTAQRFDSRTLAEAAERKAVKSENPKFNVMHRLKTKVKKVLPKIPRKSAKEIRLAIAPNWMMGMEAKLGVGLICPSTEGGIYRARKMLRSGEVLGLLAGVKVSQHNIRQFEQAGIKCISF